MSSIPDVACHIPEGLSPDDRANFDRLAKSFRGRFAKSPPCYFFTPTRHGKFMLLHAAGFRPVLRKGPQVFWHPDHARSFNLGDAVMLAKIMTKNEHTNTALS